MNAEAILTAAHAAATDAILNLYTEGKREMPFNCGFAWVTIDGREPLARACVKKIPSDPRALSKVSREDRELYGSKGYPRGWQWWKPGKWPTIEQVKAVQPDFDDRIYEQDMDFHYAGARAFAEELAKHGIRAVVGTRLD